MKKILLLILFLISSNVFADWIFVEMNTRGDEFYIDLQTIFKEGNKTMVWRKTNYPNPTTEMKSMRTFEEIDCKKRTRVTLSATAFSEVNFNGDILAQWSPERKIDFIAPDTMLEEVMNAVCK